MTTDAVTNPFQACFQILLKPNGVFEVLEDAKNWSWIPFLILSGITILPLYLYLGAVDFEWYKDITMAALPFEFSPAEMDAIRANMTLESTQLEALLSPLSLIIASTLLAGYLNLATKGDEENINGFMDWYGFAWWVSLPAVFSGILGIGLIVLSGGGEMSPAIVSPTSLSFIFGLLPGNDWFTILQALNLTTIWSIYLTAVGINRWTDLGSKKSTIIAILPYALIFGIWTIVIIV